LSHNNHKGENGECHCQFRHETPTTELGLCIIRLAHLSIGPQRKSHSDEAQTDIDYRDDVTCSLSIYVGHPVTNGEADDRIDPDGERRKKNTAKQGTICALVGW
jgi:hypothetical protein